MKAKQCHKIKEINNDWMDCCCYNGVTYYRNDKRIGDDMDKPTRFEDIPKMTVEDLESEINFYQWLIDHEPELGGVEMNNRVWLEAIKIDIKRRGLIIEKRLKLVKGVTEWKES